MMKTKLKSFCFKFNFNDSMICFNSKQRKLYQIDIHYTMLFAIMNHSSCSKSYTDETADIFYASISLYKYILPTSFCKTYFLLM